MAYARPKFSRDDEIPCFDTWGMEGWDECNVPADRPDASATSWCGWDDDVPCPDVSDMETYEADIEPAWRPDICPDVLAARSAAPGRSGADPREHAGVAGPGDARADVASLYAGHAARLRGLVRRGRGGDDSEDVVQESFVRLLGGHTARPLRSAGAYLTRITQNLLRDRAKIARRREVDRHMPADETLACPQSAERMLEARDLLDRIDRAMLELPLMAREIFLARRLDGRSYEEIAAQTGLTVRQVEKSLARTHWRLVEQLGEV